MLFDDLLIHTCDLTLPGKKYVDEDNWGRPIYEKNEPETVKCRFMTKKVYVRNSSGTDRVIEMSLHLRPDTAVDPQMTVENIKDDKGICSPRQILKWTLSRLIMTIARFIITKFS